MGLARAGAGTPPPGAPARRAAPPARRAEAGEAERVPLPPHPTRSATPPHPNGPNGRRKDGEPRRAT